MPLTKDKKSNISPDEYLDLFNKAMKKLQIAFIGDKQISEARFLIYFEHLHTYSIEEIQSAVDRAIHEEEYSQIPPVGKLIRFIEEARSEREERWPSLEAEALLEDKSLSRERNKEEAIKILKFIDEKLGKLREAEEKERKKRWEINKRRLDGQKKIIVPNPENPGYLS